MLNVIVVSRADVVLCEFSEFLYATISQSILVCITGFLLHEKQYSYGRFG